jgi:hypothetical protein
MGIEPFPMVKNSSLFTIGSNPFGLMGIEPCPMVKNSSLFTIGSNPFGKGGIHAIRTYCNEFTNEIRIGL